MTCMIKFIFVAYSGNRCEVEEDNCAEDQCFNGGMCKDEHLDFTCLCLTTANFTGKRFVIINFSTLH